MKKAKFLRVTALTLALIFVLACGTVAISANDSSQSSDSGSVSDMTTSDIQELLNAISYSEYITNIDTKGTPNADADIVIDATEQTEKNYWKYVLKNGAEPSGKDDPKAEIVERDGKKGLLIPETGTITWTTDKLAGLKAAKYYIEIVYYPEENKAAPIERVLLINGSIPFSEARQLSMDKIWVTKEEIDENVYSEPYKDIALGSEVLGGKKLEVLVDEAKKNDVVAYGYPEAAPKYIRYERPTVWTAKNTAYIEETLGIRFFTADIDNNEIRASLDDAPEWTTYFFKDASGYMQYPFELELEPDKNGNLSIGLRSVNEPVVISEIRLVKPTTAKSYKQYLQDIQSQYGKVPAGKGTIKIEGEYFGATSSQTIYPVSDNTSAITSPVATDRSYLNTVGGDKWQSAGQWIEYSFRVTSDGMYEIVPRFKQNLLDGMYVSRALYIYSSDGMYNGLPFDEAGRLQFDYSSEWQTARLSNGVKDKNKRVEYKFFFKEGVEYTLRFEVSLGRMGNIVSRVQTSLNAINNDYLNILKLTGSTPDEYRDYGFNRVMPDTMADLYTQSQELYAIAAELEKEAGESSSNSATLEKIARLLEKMFYDEDEVAKNLEQLKTYIGSLGTWLSDAKTQPLTIDYINIQPVGNEIPKANANFFEMIWHEIKGFFQSFFRNYDRMGAMTEVSEEETVQVWLAYGRDQSQVIRGLINNDFTKKTNIPVNLKLVSGGTLLPSILSGNGPDVYIGLGQGDVINYAIRGALISIDDLPYHDDYYNKDRNGDKTSYNTKKFETEFKNDDGSRQSPEQYIAEYNASREDFNEAALMVLEIANSDGIVHCYGLPETQNFNMMFVREDILAELEIEIPKTWDDVKKAIPVLQANNMQIGMHQDVKIFLYQNGGDLFADDGMRINLDSNVALDSFNTMCDFFTMYSFPYKYDFANRFRTGEMPIGFATYTATYNQLKVFATEIEGLWSFYPMPGIMDENGKINNASVSAASAIVMITGCDKKHDSWEFMRWHVDDQCQIDYSNEMVAILGPSAKHATANESALSSMPWTAEELEQLEWQFNNLAAVPNYPGNYIVDRYLKFAFLDAYDDNKDPAKALEYYVNTINKEITRKREEFDLETLEYKVGNDTITCPTLANKRLRQTMDSLNAFIASDKGKGYDVVYENIKELILVKGREYETEDFASLREFADILEAQATEKGGEDYQNAVKHLEGGFKIPADKNKRNDAQKKAAEYVEVARAIRYMREAASALEVYERYK